MAALARNGQRICANSVKLVLNGIRISAIRSNCGCLNRNIVKNKTFLESHHFYTLKGNFYHTTASLHKIVQFYLSDIGEGIREVHVKEWYVKVGDKVEQFDNICEVQSDKASATITSRFDGKITKLYHKIDDIALVGKPLIDIDVQNDDGNKDQDQPSSESSDSSDDEGSSIDKTVQEKLKVLATPAVRRIAMQNKLDLSTVTATGKGGRVLKEDVLKFLNISSEDSNDVQKMKDANIVISDTQTKNTPSIVMKSSERITIGEDKTVPITGFTKAMVKTMKASLKIPHFVYSDEIDVSQLVAIRASTKEAAAAAGVNLTFMPFFIKAASLALSKYPILNSSVDEECENITYKAGHNIGVAMDTPKGLVVPNIKNVQVKSILQIGCELNRLQQNGQNGTLKTDDLLGGTFSLSNIGIIGGTYTKPVILTPQVAIGALGKIQVLPRYENEGNIVKAHIVCISWSADHRIIDGVTMANFSNRWKHYIENPSHLMLDL